MKSPIYVLKISTLFAIAIGISTFSIIRGRRNEQATLSHLASRCTSSTMGSLALNRINAEVVLPEGERLDFGFKGSPFGSAYPDVIQNSIPSLLEVNCATFLVKGE